MAAPDAAETQEDKDGTESDDAEGGGETRGPGGRCAAVPKC